MAQGVRAYELNEHGKEAEEQSPFEHKQDKFPTRRALVHSPTQSQRKSRAHGEEKKWKNKVHPGNSRQRAIELESRRRLLRVIHPRREGVLIKGKLAGKDHGHNGQAPQRVQRHDTVLAGGGGHIIPSAAAGRAGGGFNKQAP